MSGAITLEQKMKAMREVQRIYDLSKKWQRPPGHSGRMPNFAAMADSVMKKAMDAQIVGDRLPLDIRDGKLMHEHDSRTARIIERTLRNGVIHPDVLHSFQSGRTKLPPQGYPFGPHRGKLDHDPALPDFDLFVQHSDQDLHYPSHFVPGEGFQPKTHIQDSHVQLAPAASVPTEQVPTQQGVVRPQAGQGYV
jgi:hypothetical protein